LINRSYPADLKLKNQASLTQWERFHHQVVKLNEESAKNVEYKVLFLGRHGEGWHNAAETYYGTPAWNVSFIHSFFRFMYPSRVYWALDSIYCSHGYQ
jgi:hypothetical protein